MRTLVHKLMDAIVYLLLALDRLLSGAKLRRLRSGGLEWVYLDSGGDGEPLGLVLSYGGFAESTRYGVQDHVERLRGFLRDLGIERPHLGGIPRAATPSDWSRPSSAAVALRATARAQADGGWVPMCIASPVSARATACSSRSPPTSKGAWSRCGLILLATLAEIAVGTPVARRPPHRSVRAELPHTAPTLGEWRRSV